MIKYEIKQHGLTLTISSAATLNFVFFVYYYVFEFVYKQSI